MLLIFPAVAIMRFCGIELVSKVWLQSSLLFVGLATVFVSSPVNALNPDRKITQYAHTAWRLQDGFFVSSPFPITQTADGYIWIGTNSGLLRFDGLRFTSWAPPGEETLQTMEVSALLATSDGSLWIGSPHNGLWRWHDQHLTGFLLPDPSLITSIIEDPHGSVWVTRWANGDSGSVCEVVGGDTRCYGSSNGIPQACCWSIATDGADAFWLSGGTQLARWRPRSATAYVSRIPGVIDNQGTSFIAALPDGSAWVATLYTDRGRGLQHFLHGKWIPFRARNWISRTTGATTVLLDSKNSLWIGTNGRGLYRIRDGRADHYSSAQGLSGDVINNIFEDREGNLWVTNPKGVDCFHDRAVSTFSAQEGLSGVSADSVLASKNGTVWVGGDSGLDALSKGTITSLRRGSGLPGIQVTSLLEDHLDRLWVGIDHTMSILKDGRFSQIKRPDGSPLGFVVGIAEDVNHDVWAETSGNPRELIHIRNLHVIQVFPVPRMPAARRVAPDPAGGIWLGLMNGDLARFRQGKLDTFHFPHKGDSYVNEVIVNPDGTVMGATGFGLIAWRERKQQILTVRNGLPCDSVNTLVRDGDGALWLYTQCGLVRITQQELEKWWSNSAAVLHMRFFDATDGVQAGVGAFQAAALAQDRKLWFVNQSVVQMIDPDHLPGNSIPPPVHVQEITADRRAFSLVAGLKLPALTRDVAIRYTALSFVAPQRVYFRYMLEGQDKTWQDAGTRREAFYTNLGPRSYRFRVIACNNDGLWNETGDSFSFTIEPAYYQTTWFAFLCVVAVMGMLWLLYFLRFRQAQEQIEQRLGARLEEREQIARELHDTLLQGFQGLMLRFQSVLKMLPANETVHKAMESVLERADEVLLEGRQSVQGIRKDGAGSTALEQALTQCGHELGENYTAVFSIAVVGTPQALGPVIFNEVYRIAREALFNAFQHARATKIEAELTYGGEAVSLTIRDDGIGINPEFLNSGKEGHWGLSGMRERAQRIGATLNIWSKPGSGTELELRLPVKLLSERVHSQSFLRRLGHGQWRP